MVFTLPKAMDAATRATISLVEWALEPVHRADWVGRATGGDITFVADDVQPPPDGFAIGHLVAPPSRAGDSFHVTLVERD